MVNDLDNGGQAAALKLEHAANLDAAPACRSDLDRCHFGRRSDTVGRVSDSFAKGASEIETVQLRKMAR